jgi:glycosyltransferase involved in cell wall biosynthesis
MIMNKILISVIVPVYNEKGNIEQLYLRIRQVFEARPEEFELIFIDDGSTDGSHEVLQDLTGSDRQVRVLSFTRNFGHQQAVSAGLKWCRGSCAVIIDADLQDPPELIPEMIEKWRADFQVVFATRSRRIGENFMKRATAALFYRLMHRLSNVDIPLDTGDFRLIDRAVIDLLNGMPERHRFLRGMVSWGGFRQTGIMYERQKRYSGKTKYPMFRMMKFALTGVTSFSLIPLQLASYFGFIISGIAFLTGLYAIYLKLFTDATIQGWTSLMIAVLFIGGVQLITLGIIGEYIGRISDEVKQRPLYIIREKINFDAPE